MLTFAENDGPVARNVMKTAIPKKIDDHEEGEYEAGTQREINLQQISVLGYRNFGENSILENSDKMSENEL